MPSDDAPTDIDIGGCFALLVCNVPLFGVLWLVPDERSLSGHGMSLDRFFTALFFVVVAAVVTGITAMAFWRKRYDGSGLLLALWQTTCFKIFCFLDVPLLGLMLANLVSR